MTAEAEKVVAVVTVVVEEEASATEITLVKAAVVELEIAVVKPEAAIETTTGAKPEATESTLVEVVEAAAAKHERITCGKAAVKLTAPACRLCGCSRVC